MRKNISVSLHPQLSVLSWFSQNRLQQYLSGTGLQVTAAVNWETRTQETDTQRTHRHTVKHLNSLIACREKDNWGLHKPHICLTAEMRGPLRKRDEAFSNNGLKTGEKDGQRWEREREIIPFMLIASSLYHACHMLIKLDLMYCICNHKERACVRLLCHKVRGVTFTVEDQDVRVSEASFSSMLLMKMVMTTAMIVFITSICIMHYVMHGVLYELYMTRSKMSLT